MTRICRNSESYAMFISVIVALAGVGLILVGTQYQPALGT